MAAHPDAASDLVNPALRTVTVWSDTSCPWSALALHTLRTRARERDVEVLIDHRAFPLELFNGIPTPKHIVDVEVVAIAGALPELGWKAWHGPVESYPVTTLPAMEAVQAAKDPAVGGLLGSDELDTALRRAFFVDSRCISVHAVILELARDCEHVDHDRLAEAMARGTGREAVYRQWSVARGPRVQGSPHLFAANGYAEHNPGATYHWTGEPPAGFPRLDEYRREWADELLDGFADS